MRKIFIFLSFALAVLSYRAQGQNTVTPDPRLSEIYTQTEIQSLLAKSPDVIEYYNFLLEKAWFVLPIEPHKMQEYNSYPYLYEVNRNTKNVSSVYLTEAELANFNLLKYQYDIKATRNYYRVPNANKILVIYAQYELTKKFNEYRGITE